MIRAVSYAVDILRVVEHVVGMEFEEEKTHDLPSVLVEPLH